MAAHDAVEVSAAEAEWSEKRGLWLRPGTYDDKVAAETQSYLRDMPPRESDTLLDVGANIGSVAAGYLRAGVAWVVSVEPEPDNCAMWRRNVEEWGERAVLLERAAVGGGATRDDTVPLYLSQASNKGNHSTAPRVRPRLPSLEVPVAPMRELLDWYSPTLVKVDIEGGEYEMQDELCSLPGSVRMLTLELHMKSGRHRERASALHDRIQVENGMRVVAEHGSLERRWFAVRTYERAS